MRTSEKPSGHGLAIGVYNCEATLCAATSHAGDNNRHSQVVTLVAMIWNVIGSPNQESRETKRKRKWWLSPSYPFFASIEEPRNHWFNNANHTSVTKNNNSLICRAAERNPYLISLASDAKSFT